MTLQETKQYLLQKAHLIPSYFIERELGSRLLAICGLKRNVGVNDIDSASFIQNCVNKTTTEIIETGENSVALLEATSSFCRDQSGANSDVLSENTYTEPKHLFELELVKLSDKRFLYKIYFANHTPYYVSEKLRKVCVCKFIVRSSST